jgi:DNA primase
MIPQDFIHQLLDRTDIVAVVERYVPLKKAGANWQARCPFHNEKSPSFTVSQSKQFYHCFGCGAHGTAISFLMEHAGYSFIEAVKELASQAGMVVPEDGNRRPPEEETRRQHLFERMETAQGYYKQTLKTSPRAIDYLRQRGVNGETAARFGLGYVADDWRCLAEAVGDYDDPLLVEAGLVISHEGKRYDRFRDRIMFPIRNERGQVIAFGGRVLDKGEPKYLNSPETPLFHKGRELYGLFEHRRAIQEAGRVIVVEGYMDVVMLDQHGVNNAVATLGTAITADQAARLNRLTDEVLFAFDGDAAGRRAAWRALENSLPVVQDGKRLTFLFLPDGEDPDSYVRAQGKAAFDNLCKRALPLSEFLFAELTKQTDLQSEEGRVRLQKLAQPYLAKLSLAPLLAQALGRKLAQLIGAPAPRSPRSVPPPRASQRPAGRASVQASPWRILLQAVLHDTRRAGRVGPIADETLPEAQALAALLALLREHPEFGVRDLPVHFAGRPEQAVIETCAAEALNWPEDYDVEADFAGALAQIRARAGKAEVRALSSRRPSEMSAEEKARLLAGLKQAKPQAD